MNQLHNKILDIFLQSDIIIINEERLSEYIYYCIDNMNNNIKGKTSHHHILPKKLFPEYNNIKENSWNGTHLLYSDHYYAHWLLTESIDNSSMLYAFCAMHNQDLKLGRINKSDLIPTDNFQKKMEECSINHSKWWSNNKIITSLKISKASKGMCSVIDLRDNTKKRVTKKEFDNCDFYVGVNKNKFKGNENVSRRVDVKNKISETRKNHINVVITSTGKVTSINKSDFNPIIHTKWVATALTNNLICVYDNTGKMIRVSPDNSKFISGEYTHINKGRKRDKLSIDKQKSKHTSSWRLKASIRAKECYKEKLEKFDEHGNNMVERSALICQIKMSFRKKIWLKLFDKNNNFIDILPSSILSKKYIVGLSNSRNKMGDNNMNWLVDNDKLQFVGWYTAEHTPTETEKYTILVNIYGKLAEEILKKFL